MSKNCTSGGMNVFLEQAQRRRYTPRLAVEWVDRSRSVWVTQTVDSNFNSLSVKCIVTPGRAAYAYERMVRALVTGNKLENWKTELYDSYYSKFVLTDRLGDTYSQEIVSLESIYAGYNLSHDVARGHWEMRAEKSNGKDKLSEVVSRVDELTRHNAYALSRADDYSFPSKDVRELRNSDSLFEKYCDSTCRQRYEGCIGLLFDALRVPQPEVIKYQRVR